MVKKYDKVRLKDGRTATIVEVLEEGVAYLADIDLPGPDWDTGLRLLPGRHRRGLIFERYESTLERRNRVPEAYTR